MNIVLAIRMLVGGDVSEKAASMFLVNYVVEVYIFVLCWWCNYWQVI